MFQRCSRLLTAFSPLGLVVLLSAGLTDVSAADTENPLPQILRDWEKRRQDVAMVGYKFSGVRTWHRGGMRPLSEPGEDVPCDYDVTLDFQNNRCRLSRDDATSFPIDGNPALLDRYKVLEVGDAGVCYCHIIENTRGAADKRPRPLAANFMIMRGDVELIPVSSFQDMNYWPLFFGSGVIPTGDQRLKRFCSRRRMTQQHLSLRVTVLNKDDAVRFCGLSIASAIPQPRVTGSTWSTIPPWSSTP